MFRYRAARKNYHKSTNWYLFKLQDCPALLWDDAFVLTGKTKTPILDFNTVVRGHPDTNIFEGDVIYDKRSNERLGVVVYNNGFFMQNNHTQIKKTIPKRHIYVSKGDKKSVEILNTLERTPISFKYIDIEFSLDDLVSVEGDALNIIVQGKNLKINVKGVSELLYYNKAEKYKGYKGDIINGIFIDVDNVASIESK